MPLPIPPKPTLKAVPTVEEARIAMWDGWEDQCKMAYEALVEGILFQIPSDGPPDRTIPSLNETPKTAHP